MNKLVFKTGSHKYRIDLVKNENYSFIFEENTKGTLFLETDGEGQMDLDYNFEAYSDWNVLVLNRSNAHLLINESINLKEHAILSMNYGELTYGKHIKKSVINFLGYKSQANFNAAILSFDSINWEILAHHQAKGSKANVNNHAIVLKNASLDLDIIGKIDNGFSGSETHQMTRIMNLGDGLNTIVHPQLLIEENDVAASHAASVGQANEEHIYYLQSRGLSKEEALKLIVLGYLMPIVKLIPEKENQEILAKEIESKVMEAWEV